MEIYQGNCHYADVTLSLEFEPLEDFHVTKHMRMIGECIIHGRVEWLFKGATTVQHIEHNTYGKEDDP